MVTTKPNEQASSSVLNQYIVGIGASAGGLEAINELFDNMPSNTGFSFIIIQHLSPDYKSLMRELLGKHTTMPVFEAEDGMIPKPDCVYLIPTQKIITIRNGRLRLEEKLRDSQPNTAIDKFFESLAIEKAEKSVGIILSGTGTDGTKGIQEIKSKGGIVIVQDPVLAQFDGMPNSAVASGCADLILPAEMIAEELVEFVQEVPFLKSFNTLNNQEEAVLMDIMELIYKTTGHDFSNYKRPTIHRRLAKRMFERNIKTISDYYNYLGKNPEEIKKLYKEFLLHVTQFFRDEEAFESLKTVIIPAILSKKENGDAIKVWTVACSTGEEAYSIAMLFDECIQDMQKHNMDVKIFASDISEPVIEMASRGWYSEEQVRNISPERLRRFFTKESGGYKIAGSIRKMIVFAKHDVTQDPPFSKIDLLTCRNMLIYMNSLLQKNILHKFHFAINEDGYLFLGASENIGILKDIVLEIDKKWKIYQLVNKSKSAATESFSNPSERAFQSYPVASPKVKNALHNLADIFKETLLEEYNYAGIFIDKDFDVKQAIGNFKKFMEFPEGSFNFNLLKLVPTDLSIALSTGIRKATNDHQPVVQRNVKVQDGMTERSITIIIKPYLMQKAFMQQFIFIILKEEEIVKRKTDTRVLSSEQNTAERIEELEIELRDTKENLQALIEEIESSNEELQSSNEEIISSNEELQSTNEELQSLNEELHTVNAEHQLKIKELIELNDDLNNYFRNTEIGQILIDRRMIIRKFSPAATKQVNLIATDIGRSIVDISTNIKNLDFVNDIKSVMQSGKVVEKELMLEDRRSFLMRIVPYLKQDKTNDGVVVNFVDISETKRLTGTLEAVLNSSTSGIVALQSMRNDANEIVDFEFISANTASEQLLDMPELKTKRFHEVYGHVDSKIFETYVQVVETGNTTSFEFLNGKNNRWFEIIAVKMMDGLVITFSDVTDRKTATERIKQGYEALKVTSHQLEVSNYRLEQSNLDLLQFASVASHDLKEPLRKIQAFGNLLKSKVDSKLDVTENSYLDKMINSSNRMHGLIEDILTLSRLSKSDNPHSDVNLTEVIKQIVDDLEISIREKGANIVIKKLPTVKAIPGQMHQLFQNVISNAIKFCQDCPEITIGEEPVSADIEREFAIRGSDFYTLYIQDNGIGFDTRYSEKIFGVFQRLEKGYEGTGIGLAIVKKIVDNHKGYIKAESKPGEGSRFTILLPKK